MQDTALERHDRFLGEASRILGESLEYQETLRSIARLAVPEIADLCIIDLVRDGGPLVRVATEHRDAARAGLASQLHHRPPDEDSVSGAPHVVRTARSEYVRHISESVLQQRERDPDRLRILRRLEVNSIICAPLLARRRVLGTITLMTELDRELTPDDVRMTEDLAERAATAIANARLYADAQRALRAREEVLAVVTHDLRTPLAAVVMAAALLDTADAQNPDISRIRQCVGTIQRAAHNMSRLLRDLTDLAHIDAGRLAIEKDVEDAGRLVREAVATLEPVVSTRGGTLRCEVGPDVPPVACDRDRILQVISNLVGNASKVGASSITVRLEPRQGELIFSVEDTGPGIPADDLPNMFDRYWRGRNVGYKGTGMGLPISHGIVKGHGGRMWIESTMGVGSTFYFSIPLDERAAPRTAHDTSAGEGDIIARGGNSRAASEQFVNTLPWRSPMPDEPDNEHQRRSPQSPPAAGPFLRFDLRGELARLHEQPEWTNGQSARTLVKFDDFRVVLIALRARARIAEHQTRGRISIHAVLGHIVVRADGRTFDLPVGALLALDHGLAHDVEALEESAFLLTIAWPG